MARAEGSGCARRRRRFARRALVAFPTLVLSAIPIAAQTPDQVQKAAQEAIRKLDLQTELPHEPWRPPSNWHIDLPPELLWVVVAVAVGILLYAFRDLIPIWRQSGSAAAEQEEAGAGEVSRRAPAVVLGAADELAAQGRFVDAMHVLLLHGLAHIRERLDLQLSDSLTSREILRSARLPNTARGPLRDVVMRVELTYFGQHPAGASDYAACRESFGALEHALSARSA